MDKKSWEQFRNTGLLWFINSTLHLFGWAIVMELDDDGKVTSVYPARVSYLGFSENDNTTGYRRVTSYLKENIDDLDKEMNKND